MLASTFKNQRRIGGKHALKYLAKNDSHVFIHFLQQTLSGLQLLPVAKVVKSGWAKMESVRPDEF